MAGIDYLRRGYRHGRSVPYAGGEGDIGLERAEEMDPATGTLTEGDIGISAPLGPFEHEGSIAQDQSKLLEIAKRLMEKYRYPYSKAIQIAKKILAGIVPTPEETEDISREDIREWLDRKRYPQGELPEGWPPKGGFPDPGMIIPKPPLHKDATQIPHHLDINPMQTLEFRDSNQDGIEDRSQGIYDQPRDLIPWEFDKSRKWKRNISPEMEEKYKELFENRPQAAEGGLMNLGGMEKDYRQEGGFVPIGGKEKADDVPARLSKNEFVFTADAVRAAGGGDIDQGAEVMENVMKNLEAGGEVSEDSQGLEGARGMFANAQQLQKRIV